MPEIVISEFMDMEAVASLKADFDLVYDEKLVDRPDELIALAADCRALVVRNRTQVRGALLAAAKKLSHVGRLGVGLDNIDLVACKERNIVVIPAVGANIISVAEYVMAGLLMLARGCYGASEEVASGAWPRSKQLGGREIYGKTLGLVGFGSIARAVALRAEVMGMSLVAYDPFIAADDPCWAEYRTSPVSLDELVASSDAISLHVPLTPESKNLFNAERIAAMRQGAWLINTARGGTLDEKALAQALHSGKLGGAMLDVYENEPLPANSVLAGVPRCILTAHIAGLTNEANTRVSSMIAQKIKEALAR